jgi:GDP-4-dehydro-6-deoxy-D-mannose reductase
MTPRRILITGASGFVGGHLIPQLTKTFPEAELALCRARKGGLDMADAGGVRRVIEEARPDACVHLAAVSTLSAARSNPSRTWQVNLHGTLALADSILRVVPDCVLLYVSSAEVYGGSFRAGTMLDEHALLSPMNVYAATKAAADLALGALVTKGLRVVRLRPFNHTGPRQSLDFVIPAFARQVALIAAGRQSPRIRVGSLDTQRDFLDVRDVCSAYVSCLQLSDVLASGTIFNIASGFPRSIGDILSQLLNIAGISPILKTDASLVRPIELPITWGDPTNAHSALSWSPRIPWEQTLRDTLDDWQARVNADT